MPNRSTSTQISRNWLHCLARALAPLTGLLVAVLTVGSLQPLAFGQVPAPALKPGAILYTDSGDAVVGGAVIMLDPVSGERTIIASGLDLPLYLVVDTSGRLIVSAAGRLVQIDPEKGQVSILADILPPFAGYACGLATDRHARVVCADLTGVVAVDPNTLALHEILGCSNLPNALGVAVAENGDLIVLMRDPAQVVRVNPHNGKITVIAAGGYLNAPQSIAMRGHDIWVTDVTDPQGNFGTGTVIHIDDRDGSQTLAAYGENLVQPMGIAIDEEGQLVVADPYTIAPSTGAYDGAILRINPITHVQTVLARGEGSFRNPRGVVIVPNSAPEKPGQIRQ